MIHANYAQKKHPLIWADLLHLGYNMWADRKDPKDQRDHSVAKPYLRCNLKLWRHLVRQASQSGVNMILIDLGEGVQYETHPELAVRGAWSHQRLKQELAYIRKLGMEPIPKLNFSTSHNLWLGPYARCVSTDTYYQVCKNLIHEVIELFDHPRFFHLGMDEETASHQSFQSHVIVRQHDLWWHDLYDLVDQVQRHNVRPWIWADSVWHHPQVFFKKMPRTVLQSNWYYRARFSPSINYVKAFHELDKRGYDQVPAGSNWRCAANFPDLVRYTHRHLSPDRLLGFMMTPWHPTLPDKQAQHMDALAKIRQARQWHAKHTQKPNIT